LARNGRLSENAINTLLIELGADVSVAAKKELLTGGETILSDAKARIHSISGALSASGKIEVNKSGTIVRIVFDATSPATAHSTGGYRYAKIVEFYPGHEHPYLYPAYDAHRDQIKQNVIEAIQKAVRNHAVP
jgi:hypothetical protein